MYKATREFIKARQPYSKYSLYVREDVKRIGGGIKNKCFENSLAAKESGTRDNIKVVCMSGWLVQPYDKKNNATAILQHWWNVNSLGEHFDTSPLNNEEEEYVLDFDIYQFSQENLDKIKSNVTKNLMLQDGIFYRLENFETMEFTELNNLQIENLFTFI
jgi:hypothetical protein